MSDTTLPIHPRTGLQAIGMIGHRPVWPIQGGSGEGAEGTEGTETGTGATEQKPEELPADHPLVKTLAEQKTTIKELKAKAKRLDELEDAQKTESEKAADKLKAAEAEVAAVPAKVSEALKQHLVKLHGIEAEDADLFLTATDPELLLKQIDRLLGQSGKAKKNYVPREGTNTKAKADGDHAFVREFFGGKSS